MKKIMIVEDEDAIGNELSELLENNNYKAIILKDFKNALNEILSSSPNLILLDINIPYINGEILLQDLRKSSNIPVIMVTSNNSETDEALSISYGADHYITKPYNIQILLAKIASLLRRKDSNAIKDKIDAKDFILNLSNSTIERSGKTIELTKNEYKILKYLIENRGKIVSREDIMECLWESESFIDDNTLSVNITRLRNKLEELDLKELIETKRGQGYILKGEN